MNNYGRVIDLSYANGDVNFEIIKNAKNTPISAAIIRLGFGGDYINQDDEKFYDNVKKCEKYNIPYGVYLYSYADSEKKAKSEAMHALRVLGNLNPVLPVFYDIEEKRTTRKSNDKILSICRTFAYEIEKAGFEYGTYASLSVWNDKLRDSWYQSKKVWVAQWSGSGCSYKKRYDLWQYTSSGKIYGGSFQSGYGPFDLNYIYYDFKKAYAENKKREAEKVLKISAKLEKISPEEMKKLDRDGDGKITAKDARKILTE